VYVTVCCTYVAVVCCRRGGGVGDVAPRGPRQARLRCCPCDVVRVVMMLEDDNVAATVFVAQWYISFIYSFIFTL
jgi:hypothetical protein